MEPDRYQKNHPLYIFGMVCFLISMGLLLFSFFMLPHLLFGARYDVPEFIAHWREYLASVFGITDKYASTLISLFLTLSGILFGFGAYYASTRLDNVIYGIKDTKEPGGFHISTETQESLHVFWKVLALIALFYIVIFIFLWLLSAPISFP